jgi:hypothetical protein
MLGRVPLSGADNDRDNRMYVGEDAGTDLEAVKPGERRRKTDSHQISAKRSGNSILEREASIPGTVDLGKE